MLQIHNKLASNVIELANFAFFNYLYQQESCFAGPYSSQLQLQFPNEVEKDFLSLFLSNMTLFARSLNLKRKSINTY